MKGGRRFGGWRRVDRGSGAASPPDYYLLYLRALAKVVGKRG